MAPDVGFEPTTNRLTADYSTAELIRNMSLIPFELLIVFVQVGGIIVKRLGFVKSFLEIFYFFFETKNFNFLVSIFYFFVISCTRLMKYLAFSTGTSGKIPCPKLKIWRLFSIIFEIA